MLRVQPGVPVVLDAIELSRTHLNDRVVVSCAVDLRQIEWRSGRIIDATIAVRGAAVDRDAVRLFAAAGPSYAGRDAASAGSGDISLNAVGLRELTQAAGGFFFVDVETRVPAHADMSVPKTIRLLVNTRAVAARTRAAA